MKHKEEYEEKEGGIKAETMRNTKKHIKEYKEAQREGGCHVTLHGIQECAPNYVYPDLHGWLLK